MKNKNKTNELLRVCQIWEKMTPANKEATMKKVQESKLKKIDEEEKTTVEKLKELKKWEGQQRSLYKAGKLAMWKIKKLNEIDFDFNEPKSFNEAFTDMVRAEMLKKA